MKKSVSILFFYLICANSNSQNVDIKRNSFLFHGGIGIPILISTSSNDNPELFKMGKSLWNFGMGFGYSRRFTKDLSYSLYMEFREFDYDNEELNNFVQNQNIGYSAIEYQGPDMFFSYANTFLGLKYTKSIKRMSLDLLFLTGPTFYFLAEPTVNLKENGGNNILTFRYRDGNGVGYSINPQLYVGYRIKKRLSLLIRCSYLGSFAKINYQKQTSDLLDLKYTENIKTKQSMNTIITGIGFKIEF
jgi:hypothetical protein